MIDEGFAEACFRLHSGLPREAPGGAAETLRAPDVAAPADAARIADFACGPGASATVLQEARPRIASAGFRQIDRFALPPECWDACHAPLESRADAPEDALGRTEAGAAALAQTREEIAVWRACRGDYAYAFFIVEPE